MDDAPNFGQVVFYGFFFSVLCILAAIGMWKAFVKAGKPGWAAIVPIYNVVVMTRIADVPVWWALLFFVPLVNLVACVVILVGFAKAFGRGVAFALGLWFLPMIFYPVLGFGDSRYRGGAVTA